METNQAKGMHLLSLSGPEAATAVPDSKDADCNCVPTRIWAMCANNNTKQRHQTGKTT